MAGATASSGGVGEAQLSVQQMYALHNVSCYTVFIINTKNSSNVLSLA